MKTYLSTVRAGFDKRCALAVIAGISGLLVPVIGASVAAALAFIAGALVVAATHGRPSVDDQIAVGMIAVTMSLETLAVHAVVAQGVADGTVLTSTLRAIAAFALFEFGWITAARAEPRYGAGRQPAASV